MEPPVAKLTVPLISKNYHESLKETKNAWKHKIQNRYLENNVVGIRQLNYLNPDKKVRKRTAELIKEEIRVKNKSLRMNPS